VPLIRVFDLGNVLLLVHEERCFEKLRAHCCPDADVERIFAERYEAARVDRGGDFESLHPLLVRDLGLTMAPDELRLAWNDIFEPVPAMLEFVGRAPRPRFLLSNTNQPHVEWIRERYPEIFPLFDHLVLSNEVGIRKPDPAIYRHVESLSGETPERHVFIDDLPQHVEGARQAGWHAIQFRGVEDCVERLALLEGGS
jgi:putative hydrolase of the HAD superfamily